MSTSTSTHAPAEREALRRLIERLENYYDFQCEGGPLKNCVEWQQITAAITVRAYGPVGASGEPADALEKYVEWHGGVHDEECPEDDTCDCSWKWVNDGVNAAVRYLRAASVKCNCKGTMAGSHDPACARFHLPAAASVPSPPVADSPIRFFWVMERALDGSPAYWDGGHAESFTRNIHYAVQWCRKDDLLKCVGFTKHYAQWGWTPVEHGIMASAPSAPAAAPKE